MISGVMRISSHTYFIPSLLQHKFADVSQFPMSDSPDIMPSYLVSAAKEEVKETFGYGKQDSEGSNVNSDSCSSNTKDTNHSTSGEKQQQHQKPDFQQCSKTF
nr:mitochondrial import inner membrane translocase subunit TIM44-2-like isoform X1 [Ipomoea batatas]